MTDPSAGRSAGADWRAYALIALTTIAAVLMLVCRGASCGHDFDFHLLSWMEVARDWRLGLLYPHWVVSANYGAGEPRLVFYPPGSWLLGAGLGSLFGWVTAPVAFTAACLFASGLAMQRLAREWLASREAATAAACFYVANPYMLFVAYERTAYGELLAATLLPVLLVFALRRRPPVAALALTFAAVWLSNAPTGVIASYTLLWLAIVRLCFERNWIPALRMGAAVALGLGLDGFYLLPAAYQQRWVEIARAADAPGMRIRDSFLFALTGEPYHDQVLRTASWLAVLLIATSTVSFFRMGRSTRKRLLPAITLLPLVLFLLLPASNPVWEHAPHLRFLQFPWRWLMVVSVLAAVSLAGAVARLPGRSGRAAVVSIIVLVSVSVSTWHFYQPCDEEDAVAPQRALFLSGAGVEGTDEYTPIGADNGAIQRNLPLVRMLRDADANTVDSSHEQNPLWQPERDSIVPAAVSFVEWQPERKALTVKAPVNAFAVLRLMDYPAWNVRVNGNLLTTRPRREDGLLAIPVSAGLSVIQIAWSTTPDVRWGRWLSLASLLLLVVLLLWNRISAKQFLRRE